MPEKHIHKYMRVKIGRNKRIIFKCAIPGCVHTCRPELVLGRQSICFRCEQPFFMTKYAMLLAKPHCDCDKSNIKSIEDILAEKGI